MPHLPKSLPQFLLLLVLPVGGIIAATLIIANADDTKTNRSLPVASFPSPPAVTFVPPTPLPTLPPTIPPAQASILDKPVPDFTLTTLDGSSIRLDDFRGQIIFLNFWATWCVPCQEEMPILQELESGYGREGVRVITVTDPTAGQTEDDIRAFADRYDLSMIIVLSSNQAFYQQFGAVQIPLTFIIDREGIVRYRQIGILSDEDIAIYLDHLMN